MRDLVKGGIIIVVEGFNTIKFEGAKVVIGICFAIITEDSYFIEMQVFDSFDKIGKIRLFVRSCYRINTVVEVG